MKVKSRTVHKQATGSKFFTYEYRDQDGNEITKEVIKTIFER